MTTPKITPKEVILAVILICAIVFAFVQYNSPPPPKVVTQVQVPDPVVVIVEKKATIPSLPKQEFECLAKNIYFEAGNQSIAGQLAVALVTLNRVNDPRFPHTVCSVVTQGSMADPNKNVGRRCQFSWYCNGKSNNPKKDSATWQTAKQVALDANRMFHKGIDITNGATHFHATYVKPGWAKTLERVARIDDHIFYKWNPRQI
jgi:spore germination cell wall hydrolase CwlJ-like protein